MARPRSFTLLPHSVPRWMSDPVVGVIARAGLTPNQLSLLGFGGNLGAAALAASGNFLPAGLVMLAASALDLLDGALARATGRASAFGAVLDSVLDRLSEAAVLAGLAYHFVQRGEREETMLCFVALAGSLLVSYVRARALAHGIDLREGLLTRAERVLLLGGGLIIGQARIALWVLAVLANLTAVQRLFVVWTRLRHGDTPSSAPREETP